MSVLLLFASFGAAQDGVQAALKLYAEGKYDAAAAALRKVEGDAADSPELQYDLALASWRAGDLPTAETAIEKYAALSRTPRVDLHAGLLGAVRFEEARRLEAEADAAGAPSAQAPGGAEPVDPLPLLEQALVKAKQAQDHFVRGTVAAGSAELRRNTERALRYVAALQKKIDELKRQREEQQQKDDQKDDKQEDKKDEDKKDEKKEHDKQDKQDQQDKQDKQGQKGDDKKDEKKQDGAKDKQDPSKSDQSKPEQSPSQEGQQGEPPPEAEAPEPKPEQPAEPQPDSGKQESKGQGSAEPPPEPEQPTGAPEQAPGQQPAKPPQPRNDAPGEQKEPHELSPEQTQRLLELLQQLDGKLDGIRARAKSRRPKVEKDW
ncbi:MAG: hypothetical protein KDC48_04875 [Planctomycetes bacterium]|nr:hypothetical protein [Planctomycetota bacterium]